MLVGLMAYHHVRGGVFVDYLCTSKSHRRQGLARRLLHSLGPVRVTLITLSLSSQHRFYTKLGFEPACDCPYEACMGEVCLGCKQKTSADAMMTFTSDQLPWKESMGLLRGVGLGKVGAQRFLCPECAEMRYRLVYA
jgi:hypothetical protein